MEVIIVILFCKRMGENSLLKLEDMNLCRKMSPDL